MLPFGSIYCDEFGCCRLLLFVCRSVRLSFSLPLSLSLCLHLSLSFYACVYVLTWIIRLGVFRHFHHTHTHTHSRSLNSIPSFRIHTHRYEHKNALSYSSSSFVSPFDVRFTSFVCVHVCVSLHVCASECVCVCMCHPNGHFEFNGISIATRYSCNINSLTQLTQFSV